MKYAFLGVRENKNIIVANTHKMLLWHEFEKKYTQIYKFSITEMIPKFD